jgi:glycosyltransferase involved in cell wall biosynthesis
MKPKIKVLLIAYNFPPFIRASSMRTFGWFENFSDDIDVTVITRKWDKNIVYGVSNYFQEDEKGVDVEIVNNRKKIIRVPNRYNKYFKFKNLKLIRVLKLNKLFTFLELLLRWLPFFYIDNERSLYVEAKRQLKLGHYDWVITSGEPFVLFKYALLLKKKFGVKISLDYRDGFSTNMFRNMSPNFLESLTIKLDRNFERKVLIQSDLVTFVSEKLKSEIEKDVITLNKKSTLIVNNGIDFFTFDETLNIQVEKILDKSFFNLIFVGTLYEGHNVDMLLSAIENLIVKENCKIRVTFVGSILTIPDFHMQHLKKFQNLFPENIYLQDYIENSLVRSLQKNADLLLKFNAFEQHEGHFGKKMYEYALSGRKVISINHKPTFKNKLNFFDDKPFIYYCNNSDEIFKVIKQFYNLWAEGNSISNEIEIEELSVFSTENQVKKLENCLLSIN